MEKIKLYWDFRGMDAEKTAEHHVIHLNEFSTKENIQFFDVKIEKASDFFCTATLVIDKINLEIVKTSLRPHRGILLA